jgi:flagellar hook-associated protein 2
LSLAEAVSVKVQPYLDRADAIATEISTNKTKVAAYQSMQTLLQALETATSNLSSQSTEGTNIFNSRAANLTSKSAVAGSTPTDASTLMSATVTSGTNVGTHTVVVNQLAAAEEDVSATQAVSSTTPLNQAGNISIFETGKTALNIAVTSSMSLTDIASAINGNTSQTGVSASVVSIDSGHSVLVVSGADADTPLQFSQDSGNVLSNLGLYGTSSVTATTAVSSDTTALGLAGSFTINGGVTSGSVAAPVSVTVTSSMSLNDIESAINSAATTAGSSTVASISGNALKISSGTGGSALSFTGVTGNVLSTFGIPTNGAANQVTAAQGADLTIDGVAGITRTTNSITDALSGVSLNLTAADPNTVVTVTVQPDTQSTGNAILAFVTAYNSWESFVQQNEATASDGTAAASATLFGDSTLREVSLAIDTPLTSMINNLSLADIGIALNGSNTLTVDNTTLTSSLTSNFGGIVSLFQSQISTSSYTLQTLGTDYSSYAGSFDLSVTTDPTSGSITGLEVNGASAAGLFTYSGDKIIGAPGSVYSGMSFSYSGAAGTTSTVTVTATLGLANQLYTTTTNYGNTLNGTVENLVQGLQSQDSALTSQYNTIISQANSYTTFLLNQYAALTTQIQNASYTSTVLSEMFAMQTSS